ncbi:MAG: lamin tail domain-containing protein [Patescibacteria group bacterium]|nr:lamin tail domain-containing protein [Patescibacteria group bacterium]
MLCTTTPFFSSAYDDDTTHQALTEEVVKLFNAENPHTKISSSDAELVIKGSREEDAFGRWMRHYFDPTTGRGLTYIGTQWQSSKEWAKDTIAQATYRIRRFAGRPLYGVLLDLFSGDDDYSWDRAVYEYAWGNKQRGLEALGHVLHLIEDASVPDHTRNDPHPGFENRLQEKLGKRVPERFIAHLGGHDDLNASPYEWFAKFPRGSLKIAEDLRDKQIVALLTLNDYFERLAKYSSQYFFSRDTIPSESHVREMISEVRTETLSDNKVYTFGYYIDQDGNEFRLVRITKNLRKRTVDYSIEDIDNLILTDYWNLLSKQAVLHGAGVVKLFFDEVAKEKEAKVLHAKNRSWLGKKTDQLSDLASSVVKALRSPSAVSDSLAGAGSASLLGAASGSNGKSAGAAVLSVAAGAPSSDSMAYSSMVADAARESGIAAPPVPDQAGGPGARNDASTSLGNVGGQDPSPSVQDDRSAQLADSNDEITASPIGSGASPSRNDGDGNDGSTEQGSGNVGSGAGNAGGSSATAPILAPRQWNLSTGATPTPTPTPAPSPSAEPDTTAPDAPNPGNLSEGQAFSAASDVDAQTAGVQITVTGTAEADATVTASINPSWETSTDSQGNWSLAVTLGEGANAITFRAHDAAGNQSASRVVTVTLDSVAPEPTVALSGWRITHLDYTVSWSVATSTADLASYDVQQKAGSASDWTTVLSQTAQTATSTRVTREAVTSWRVRARDTLGNISGWVELQAETNQRPVVIKEIMYRPSPGSDSFYEYVELYNRSATAIDLSSWALAVDSDLHAFLLDDTATTSPEFSASANNMVLKPGGFALVGDQRASPGDKHIYDGLQYVIPGHSSTTLRLTIDDAALNLRNASPWSTLTLKDENGAVVDEASYKHTYGANGNGKSLERINPAQGGTTAANWADSPAGGTPNQENVRYDAAAAAGTTIDDSAVISTDTIWSKAGSPYLVHVNAGEIPKVAAGGTLYIEPGVTVKPQGHAFASAAGGYTSFQVDGTLIAQGTADEPIVWTSRHTGSASTTPGKGDWSNIVFTSAAQNVSLKYVTFEYGGGGTGTPPGILIASSSPVFDRVTVRYSANAGISVNRGAPVITNSVFEHNTGYGIDVERGDPSIRSNTFTQNKGPVRFYARSRPVLQSNTAASNTSYNGHYVRAGETSADTTWYRDLPYILEVKGSAALVTVASSTTLTLEPGVVLKPLHLVNSANESFLVRGTLNASGTVTLPIIMTSLKDDSAGNDSNADGTASAPASGNWMRVLFKNGAVATLANWIVRYGSALFNGPLAAESGANVATSSIEILP